MNSHKVRYNHRVSFRVARLVFTVSTEKHSCLFTFAVYQKIKSPRLTPKKSDGLLVNTNKIVNKIICNLGKVTTSPRNLKWSLFYRLLRLK